MAWEFDFRKVDGGPDVLAMLDGKLSNRQPLHAVLGKRAEYELRNYFEKRNAEPNKRDFPKQGFWDRIRTAAAFAGADQDGAQVLISDPAMNQKVYGGTIKPTEGHKYLALANIAEAYGHSPREFDFLKVVHFHSGAVALVETDRTFIKIGRKKKDGSRTVKDQGRSQRGRVWYWLARSVTQEADAEALPPEKDFSAALVEEARDFLH